VTARGAPARAGLARPASRRTFPGMRNRLLLSLLAFGLAACGDTGSNSSVVPSSPVNLPSKGSVPPDKQPAHIAVDHILIGVASLSNPNGKRSESDARAVTKEILEKLKAGGDWEAFKRQYSEDPPPGGPYGMSNDGVPPNPGERPRNGMVPAFGDVGFTLEVGELGVAAYEPRKSPYGFHIIKRVR
jgi:hypothetical protein